MIERDSLTTELPAPGTKWLARDGRRMELVCWRDDRAKPTALMKVLNPGPHMRRFSEQSVDGFGSFLVRETS